MIASPCPFNHMGTSRGKFPNRSRVGELFEKIDLPDSETLQADDEGDGEDALPPMGEHCSSSSDAELNRDEHEDTPELQELVVELSLTERRLLVSWMTLGLLRPKFSKRRLRYRCSRCNCSLWLSTLRSRSSKFCNTKIAQ
jgi:hypothetical protein